MRLRPKDCWRKCPSIIKIYVLFAHDGFYDRENTMKRYCQRLSLVDDVEMIRQYVGVHAHVWPEVIAGQREVEILDMQIDKHCLLHHLY